MSRLRAEIARLFLPDPARADESALVDAEDRTRALVLELAAPADWAPLQAVWQGVQADLGLPAPAIAVSGVDGLQLWFSAPAPVPVADAQRWLQALCRRYLPGMAPHRLRLYPGGPATVDGQRMRHAALVPAAQPGGATWSAFVAPDLVPLFIDTPWLDLEPSEDGQAAVLGRVRVMKAGWFEAGLGTADEATHEAARGTAHPSGPGAAHEATHDATHEAAPAADSAPADTGRVAAPPAARPAMATGPTEDGRPACHAEAVAFLRRVMNDEAAPLALRVDAAKALLQAAGPVRSA